MSLLQAIDSPQRAQGPIKKVMRKGIIVKSPTVAASDKTFISLK